MKESHVREPLYIFLSNMKEMSQFCKSGNCECLLTKNRLYFQRLFITLRTIQYCWFIRMLAIVAGFPRKYQTILWHREITFMPFIGWQTFEVKLWKLDVEQYFTSFENKSKSLQSHTLAFSAVRFDGKMWYCTRTRTRTCKSF